MTFTGFAIGTAVTPEFEPSAVLVPVPRALPEIWIVRRWGRFGS